MQEIGFDIIGDLKLAPNDSFNWGNKATSLYCIVAGNVSSDLRVVLQVLAHLSSLYQGVFYVPGILEYQTTDDIIQRTDEIYALCARIPKVVLLHQHIITIDGVAVMGVNGWSDAGSLESVDEMFRTAARYEDQRYLRATIEKLQRHLDIKKVIVVSNAVPKEELYFGEEPYEVYDQIPLCDALPADTENKIKHWVFGTYENSVDTEINGIQYLNNPYTRKSPYWAKRISVSV